ncbi:hypothetical protein [Halomonas sp. C05BenzN]|uniref:hypothetical protein n=1 Tax=Halomonas sp. C05BenzN TaxID=3411041 RepID=UPI003B96086D
MSQASLSSRELLDDLVPKLKSTETFLHDTLTVRINCCLDPREKLRLQNLRTEFQLELTMIRMNLEHLLRRYSDRLVAAADAEEGDTMLALDDHEAVAIESIRRLYTRSRELQTHSGWNGYD